MQNQKLFNTAIEHKVNLNYTGTFNVFFVLIKVIINQRKKATGR